MEKWEKEEKKEKEKEKEKKKNDNMKEKREKKMKITKNKQWQYEGGDQLTRQAPRKFQLQQENFQRITIYYSL